MKNFFSELKRRNVFKVGAAYVILAWLIAQVSELALDSFEAPSWVIKTILLLLALGLPLVLFFAWAFELTPEGIKRENEVDRSESVVTRTGRKSSYLIVGFAALAVGLFFWSARDTGDGSIPGSVPTAQDRSVAVLPFVNMSPDPAQEYFSDGITEEVINAVVKIPGVSVPARTSVFAFRGHGGDVREIGTSLGVAHVLEGSVRSQGNQVRITAQLIKVDDGFHLWSETFDRKLENIFAVQEEIAAAIATALVGELGSSVNAVPNRTRNMLAYDTYLRGRAVLRRRDDEAIVLLEQATEADPEFAPAWAALAIAYQSVTRNNEEAMAVARKALELDPDNVDALNAMGAALRGNRSWLEAERYFDRALAIDPNSAELLEDYAEFLSYVGRSKQALSITRQGMEIDARLRPLVYAHMDALSSNGLDLEAYELALKVLEETPDEFYTTTYWYVVPALRSPALDPELLELEVPTGLPLSAPAWYRELIDAAAAVVSGTADQGMIDRLKAHYPRPEGLSSEPYYYRAIFSRSALMLAGQLDYLIEADIMWVRQNEGVLHEYGWNPFFAGLRQHPRYGEYLEAAGIVDYWDATEWPDWCKRGPDGLVRCR